ncbi:MAG TPA: carbonic anhydrase [Roseiarcus sp.]
MCINCGSDGIGRRDLMKFGAAAAVALAAASVSPAARAAESGPTALSPQEALAQLKAGNERFMSKPELCSVDLAASRAEVAGHQAPWTTIVACADSRVPPELIFGGHGVGELFIARDAGNLVGVETLGTIEYGAAVLGSPLVVILAHTACGAVKAACDIVTKNATYPGVIGRMIQPILPAALKVRNNAGDFVDNTAKESAKRTAANLPTVSKIVSDHVRAGKVKIVAAIYDLQTGAVTYLD